MANPARFEWANSGVDLHLELAGDGGLRTRLEEALREGIRSGRLPRGTVMPATRTLARDLGISRGTVLGAYAQLAAEGWLRGRRGSGTVVAFDAGAEEPRPAEAPRRWRYDLRPGRPDATSFPRAQWLRALRRALAAATDDAFDYGDPRGRDELRLELASYLRRARGLRVAREDVIVTSGYTQSLGLIARAVAPCRVAMEDPTMPEHRAIVSAAGNEIVSLRVDGEGAQVDELDGEALVVLTPNRQHPLGVTLSAARRARLLDWARERGAFVVEDDYDGEFRYDGRPIGPLQGLEPRHVIYAGTASKTLAPGVRLGWLAVPHALRDRLVEQKQLADWHSGTLEQLALAEFLRSTAYDRHVRKMRLRYRRRRDLLLAALAGRRVHGASAGLNLFLEVDDEDAVVEAAAARGVAVQGAATTGYFAGAPTPGVMVGYAAAPEHAFRGAVDAFVAALASVSRRSSEPRG
jgi:GntR family transcriptional regulator/MocR family aminotransferase